MSGHGDLSPSPWVVRFAPLILDGGRVLDLACGRGRHARHLADLGFHVIAADRDEAALEVVSEVPGVVTCHLDLEDGSPWPWEAEAFDAIVVANYLYRPAFQAMLDCLKPGGVLIYETFMVGNEAFGRPRSPEFLLEAGELLLRLRDEFCPVAFEQGIVGDPPRAVVQRVCAVKDTQPYRLPESTPA